MLNAFAGRISLGLVVLCFVPIASAQNERGSQSVAPKVELSAVLRQDLARLPLSTVPVASLKMVKFSDEAGTPQLSAYYERLESGLWGVAHLTTAGRTGAVQRQLSLHGLVALGGTIEFSSEVEIPIFVPGVKFLPFGSITRPIQTKSTYQAEYIKGDLSTLSNPTPGAKFSYEVSWKSSARSSNNEAKASCSVEKEMSAGTLNSKLRGAFFPITCEEVRNGQTSTRQYAYLLESRLYVMTSIVGGANEGKFKLAEVEYADSK